MLDTLIHLHDFCVVWMTAVIWLVQIFIYPHFRLVAPSEFVNYHKRHCDLISIFVTPMFLQLFTCALIVWLGPRTVEWILHLAAIIIIFTVTALRSAPTHSKLTSGKDLATIDHLMRWNWVRTLIWSAELTFVILSQR